MKFSANILAEESAAPAEGLRAPFPYFGGKSRVAPLVWERFGADVPNYVEPFAGSLAVLLGRPGPARIETVNDLDCFIANFWRALQADPAAVARWADWPVNEADLHARHRWLVDRPAWRERMRAEPDFFDAQIAGWWVWGICCWIGSGWCSAEPTGRIWEGRANAGAAPRGIEIKRPELKRGGRGVLGNLRGKHPRCHTGDLGVHRDLSQTRPLLVKGTGVTRRGLSQQLPDIGGDGSSGRGIHGPTRAAALEEWMHALAARLRRVRVCCGDWSRVLGRSPTECIGTTAVFLDPPYSSDRDPGIYAHDCLEVARRVREWAAEHGHNPRLRIALCGHEGEHAMPEGWTCLAWKANGGHGNSAQGRGRANATRERIWFSPHCLPPAQEDLFPVLP